MSESGGCGSAARSPDIQPTVLETLMSLFYSQNITFSARASRDGPAPLLSLDVQDQRLSLKV
jgi:hypothetical protein